MCHMFWHQISWKSRPAARKLSRVGGWATCFLSAGQTKCEDAGWKSGRLHCCCHVLQQLTAAVVFAGFKIILISPSLRSGEIRHYFSAADYLRLPNFPWQIGTFSGKIPKLHLICCCRFDWSNHLSYSSPRFSSSVAPGFVNKFQWKRSAASILLGFSKSTLETVILPGPTGNWFLNSTRISNTKTWLSCGRASAGNTPGCLWLVKDGVTSKALFCWLVNPAQRPNLCPASPPTWLCWECWPS